MSILPGEKLHYAETHFKFKLPWSLLYKPWPEIQTDAPFQFVPGVEPTLWIVVRDAHRFPTLIEKIDISIAGTEDFRASKTVDLQIRATEQFGFYPVKLGKLPAGNYDIYCRISAKRINENGVPTADKERSFSRWNLPGLKPAPLKIQVLAEEPPKAPGSVARIIPPTTWNTGHRPPYCSRPPKP